MTSKRTTMTNHQIRGTDRNPMPHQRLWNGHCVDKDLENEWLEKLNQLDSFNLISICQGHSNSRNPRGNRAHINLRLIENFLPLSISAFDNIVNEFHTKLIQIFGIEDTIVSVELKIKLNASRSSQRIDRDFVMRIENASVQQDSALSEQINQWFSKTISRIQQIDIFTKQIIAQPVTSADARTSRG